MIQKPTEPENEIVREPPPALALLLIPLGFAGVLELAYIVFFIVKQIGG